MTTSGDDCPWDSEPLADDDCSGFMGPPDKRRWDYFYSPGEPLIAPCHLCEQEETIIIDEYLNDDRKWIHFVQCGCCGTRGPWSFRSQLHAIGQWNDPTALRALMAERFAWRTAT
jgi:hypothetical protein